MFGSPISQAAVPFALVLRRLRLDAKLTQATLAERAGLSARGIQRLEASLGQPYPDTTRRLADALGLAGQTRVNFEAAARPAPRVHALPVSQTDLPGIGLHKLPRQLNGLVGREQALTDVRRLLATTQVLTLVGPGGVGKTRLGLAVAMDCRQAFSDGVLLLDLAPIRDPDLVLSTLARMVGVEEDGNHSLAECLIDVLRTKHVLLLVDNFEQVIEVAAEVARLVEACPNLKILATSREPLRIRRELLYSVPPLGLPDVRRVQAVQVVANAPAVALFEQRAREVQPEFALTAENAGVVAELCVRLDGLPLAIELAAARTRALSARAILARFEQRLDLLSDAPRDNPVRHQTLRSALDWSYDLLGPEEQTLFRRLSVFVDGWTLDAAEQVCSGDGLERAEVLGLLSRLVDKSLIVVDQNARPERYRLLETLRQLSSEHLATSGERSRICDQHFTWYVDVALHAAEAISASGDGWQFAWFQTELNNLRAALDYAVETSNSPYAVRLGAALRSFWVHGGYLTEAEGRLHTILALPSSSHDAARATCLTTLGQLKRLGKNLQAAREYGEEALALAREIGDTRVIYLAQAQLGLTLGHKGDWDDAEAILQESLRSAAGLGESAVGMALCRLGWLRWLQHDPAEASALLETGIGRLRALGDWMNVAQYLWRSADVALRLGLHARSLAEAHESVELAYGFGLTQVLIAAFEVLIRLAIADTSVERAVCLAAALQSIGPHTVGRMAEHAGLRNSATLQLGTVEVDRLWAVGQAMTTPEAVAFALGTSTSQLKLAPPQRSADCDSL